MWKRYLHYLISGVIFVTTSKKGFTSTMSMKPINVTIPEQMVDTLNKHKQATGITLSELVRRALDMYFNSVAKQSKESSNNAQ